MLSFLLDGPTAEGLGGPTSSSYSNICSITMEILPPKQPVVVTALHKYGVAARPRRVYWKPLHLYSHAQTKVVTKSFVISYEILQYKLYR